MGESKFYLLRYSKRLSGFTEIREEKNPSKIKEYPNKTAVRNEIVRIRRKYPNRTIKFKIGEERTICILCGTYRVITDFMGVCNLCKKNISSKIVEVVKE